MKYEAFRSKIGHYFSLNPHPGTDFNFPPHFHKSPEPVYVEEGELIVGQGTVLCLVRQGFRAVFEEKFLPRNSTF